jgi:hypothetical protein
MIDEVSLRLSGCLLVAALLAVACSSEGQGPLPSGESPTTFPARTQTPSGVPSSGRSTRAFVMGCPVTLPRRFRPPAGASPDALFGAGSSYGNGRLWVGGLWPQGVIAVGPDFIEQDGSVGMKFGWWRQVRGRLTITGRRLDSPAPPLRSDVSSGYGMRGFQASGVYFPTEGCWEVTGKVGTTSLTFVTVVIKRAT